MDEKFQRETAAMIQQSQRLSAKAAPLIMASALLQEAMNLNQVLSERVVQLSEMLKNEREKTPGPKSDGGELPAEARTAP